jgi:hypothetical protein
MVFFNDMQGGYDINGIEALQLSWRSITEHAVHHASTILVTDRLYIMRCANELA